MTWGMKDIKGEGAFWPDGHYVGWQEALEVYYHTEMSEADKVAMGMSARFSMSEFSNKFVKDRGWLKPVECPQQYKTFRGIKVLGALFKMSDRLLGVDDALKDILETIEPGVHQFWPITFVMPRGKTYPKPLYGMVIQTHLDAFRPDDSAPGSWRERNGRYRANSGNKADIEGIAMSREAIGSAHLWCETQLIHPRVYISDRLRAEIDKAGLSFPPHYKMRDA